MVWEELGLLQIHKNGTIIHRAKNWGDLLHWCRIVVLEEVEFLKNSFPDCSMKIADYWKK